MAMYDREQTKTFYSQMGTEQDTCYYCAEEINENYRAKKISIDERWTKVAKLRGSLTSKRIMKINFRGTEICVCPECLAKIYMEISPIKNCECNCDCSCKKEDNIITTVEAVEEQLVTEDKNINKKASKEMKNDKSTNKTSKESK